MKKESWEEQTEINVSIDLAKSGDDKSVISYWRVDDNINKEKEYFQIFKEEYQKIRKENRISQIKESFNSGKIKYCKKFNN